MTRDEIILENGWRVSFYYEATPYNAEEILTHLNDIGCNGETFATACDNLTAKLTNTGLCYSGDGESVVVVGRATSDVQFFNSVVHEMMHLSVHIALALGIDLNGEEICYLAGEIAQKAYPTIREILLNL